MGIVEQAKLAVKDRHKDDNHERNLKCKVVALTLLCVAVVEGAFILGTLVK